MNKQAQSDENIDFSKISSDTNGKGVYKLSSSINYKYPILYYRGAVTNNNVIFANFCWKIVRTTETGGIKLIYNGVPSNGICNNTGENSQIGTSAFNESGNSPAYVGYMYGTIYTYNTRQLNNSTMSYYYGNNVKYSNGTYTLDNIVSGSDDNIAQGHHYTCFTTETTCTNVYYIYNIDDNLTAYYITLKSGKKVDNALSEMLDNNANNSTIKTYIDNWYKNNMISYTSKLEDTEWCNDRGISNKNGWDLNKYNNSKNGIFYLYFSIDVRMWYSVAPILNCSRNIDKFTRNASNGNGNLTYSVGLLTADEVILAGGIGGISNNYYLQTGCDYWSSSPYFFIDNANLLTVAANGALINAEVGSLNLGIRPSISLKPETIISGGTGDVNSPYIIK